MGAAVQEVKRFTGISKPKPAPAPAPAAAPAEAAVPEPVKEIARVTDEEKRAAARLRARRIGARSLLGAGGTTREEQQTLGVG